MISYKEWVFLFEETGFQTDKGSVYRFDGNRTVRYKTSHMFHDQNDVGLKKISDLTVFIDVQTAKEIGMWGSTNAAKKRIVLHNNNIYLLSWNDHAMFFGMDKIIGNNQYILEPKIGLCPLELWDRDTHNWEWVKPGLQIFKKSHPGSPIIKIGNIDFPN